MKKLLIGLSLLVASSLTFAAGYMPAQNAQPPRTNDGNIEVEGVFWYGCPFCYQLEPAVQAFAADLPEGAEFIKVPAPLSPGWAAHARVYHVAAALGVLDQTHNQVFATLQQSHGKGLLTVDEVVAYFNKVGVPEAKVMEAAEHPVVMQRMSYDLKRLTALGLREVPALVVDGRYIITSRTAGGIDRMVPEALALIEQIQQENSANQ